MSAQTPMPNSPSIPAGETLLATPAKAPAGKYRFIKPICQGLAVAALAVLSYVGISHFLVCSVKVVGISMLPTLHDSERYLLNRWIYYVRSPQPAEVVVLRDPMDNGFSVKRIVAQTGDSVYLKDGNVYINGRRADEPYLAPGTVTFAGPRAKEQLFHCGADQFFVLGDNRNNSIDSRAYGPVPRRNILGLIVR